MVYGLANAELHPTGELLLLIRRLLGYNKLQTMKKLKLYLDTLVLNFLWADDAPREKEATVLQQ